MAETILIIGAGASGLVTAKILLEADPSRTVIIVEKDACIGGTFVNKRYRDSRMVSSKYLTMFSDFRVGSDADDHLTLKDYVTYLEEYADKNNLRGLIRFGTEVVSLTRGEAGEAGKWKVALRNGRTVAATESVFDAVAVCSGLHNYPKVPDFPGQKSNFKGRVVHSSDYKEPSIFAGKRVLILGTGETAFDIGYNAAANGASAVTMATRRGFVSVPSAFHGTSLPPLDCLIMNIGTHAWESDWSARVSFHWWVTTKLQRLGMAMMTGTSAGFNQWAGKHKAMTWDQGHKHIVNKSSRCMPLINRGVKRQVRTPAARWLNEKLFGVWDAPAAEVGLQLGDDGIKLIEGKQVRCFDEDGETVHFDEYGAASSSEAGRKCQGAVVSVKADLVMLATGYRQYFPFIPRASNEADMGNVNEDFKGEDPLPSEHFIVDPSEPTLAYIGFVRPNVGAIPPMSEIQAMWWSVRLQQNKKGEPMPGPRSPDYYKLPGCRLFYGVDYGRYMFALAREIGAIPNLWSWSLKNPRVAFASAFGQAHVPIFRLDGPFRTAEAEDTVAQELLYPILKRPLFMNTLFVGNAIFFGIINTIISSVEMAARHATTTAKTALLATAVLALGSQRYRWQKPRAIYGLI